MSASGLVSEQAVERGIEIDYVDKYHATQGVGVIGYMRAD